MFGSAKPEQWYGLSGPGAEFARGPGGTDQTLRNSGDRRSASATRRVVPIR